MNSRTKTRGALIAMAALASACGGSGSGSGQSAAPMGSTATVNLVVQDTPPANLTVLSFQIEITGAILQPGAVSLLPKPVTVDLAQLVSDTALLSSSVIDSNQYTSMTLTFANPQVTIVNNSAAPIVTPSQTCAIGAVCTFVPTLNTASVTISSGVFPVTVTANSSTGLALDLSIPDLLQSDLSVTAADGTSVNLSLLPEPASGVQAQIDDVLGVVQSASNGQIKMTTAAGELLVLTTDSMTAYHYPVSVCGAGSADCVSANQIVSADLSLMSAGGLHADEITFTDQPSSTVLKGVVVSVGAGPQPTLQMLLHTVLPATTGYAVGDVVDVNVAGGASYTVSSGTYPAVAGGTFAASSDLFPGQEIVIELTQSDAAGSDGNPAASSDLIELLSSQMLGHVTAVDGTADSFALTNVWSLFSALSPAIPQLQVQTGAATAFVGVAPGDLSGIVVGSNVRVKGPLFRSTVSAEPTLGAMQVSGRP